MDRRATSAWIVSGRARRGSLGHEDRRPRRTPPAAQPENRRREFLRARAFVERPCRGWRCWAHRRACRSPPLRSHQGGGAVLSSAAWTRQCARLFDRAGLLAATSGEGHDAEHGASSDTQRALNTAKRRSRRTGSSGPAAFWLRGGDRRAEYPRFVGVRETHRRVTARVDQGGRAKSPSDSRERHGHPARTPRDASPRRCGR